MAAVPVELFGRDLTAPAKINLALHVTGRRADGYHTLSSLVAFSSDGDGLSVAAAAADRLVITGRFAAALNACPAGDNIILKALAAARDVAARAGYGIGPLEIRLDKRLPVASGIGGGSADAAALLRLIAGAAPALRRELRQAGLGLGADVPMCFDGVPALVAGVGEQATALPRFPGMASLLVNPGLAVSTPAVFQALAQRTNPPLPSLPPEGFATLDGLIAYLDTTRNDLEAPAISLVPEIAGVAQALRRSGARFQRMSGSGATVFGLFGSHADAQAASRQITAAQPHWWALATQLEPARPLENAP